MASKRKYSNNNSFKKKTRTNGYVRSVRYSPRVSTSAELKFHDLDIDDAVIAAATISQVSCNIIAQGLTESTRVGRKVTVKRILWRYEVKGFANTNDNGDVVRVILYLDKQTNKATAAVTDILESADYQSFNNLANRGRFRILHDKTFDMQHQAAAGDGTTNIFMETHQSFFFVKDVSIPIEYNAGAGAITEQTSNNIGVLLLSKNANSAFFSKMRLRFSDI